MSDLPTVNVEAFVSALRKQGINVTQADIIQTLMESEDTYTVNDGNTIRVYQHGTNDLLMIHERTQFEGGRT